MAYKIALVTDSTCDIPTTWVRQYEISVVPMTIVFGSQQYLDGVDITAEQFYDRLPTEPNHPSTSQVTPHQFLQAFQNAAAAGAQSILAITISSAMSGTYNAALLGAKQVRFPVTVVDAKGPTMTIGWQVLAAARAREAGGSLDEMVLAVEEVRERLHYHIVLDTLEYLVKGGRISGAAKFIGNVLNIKPQIRVNHQTGTVEAGDVSRTRARALETLYSSFFKKVDGTKPLRIAVLHNAAYEEAKALADRITAEYAPLELIIGIVSPVLGAHTGPRAVALCGYSEGDVS